MEVREFYAKRLSVLEAILLDMDREEHEAGRKPKANRTVAQVMAYCQRKSLPPAAPPVVPSTPGEAGAR